jgi:Carboxylesterase family
LCPATRKPVPSRSGHRARITLIARRDSWRGAVGGRFTLGAGRDYDGTKLAANGIVVVTINHRLGAFGFLAHPALASHPGGPSGNYGLMDQQAALRWVQDNIGRFGALVSDANFACPALQINR